MRNWLSILLLLLLTTATQADELQPVVFTDQWGHEQRLTSNTELIIFSHHKDGSAWVKQALQALEISSMDDHHWLYVANIAGMPTLITKLFAIPKMRDYAFPIALVTDNTVVEAWPKKDDFVAIYSLNNLAIESVEYFNSADAVRLYLESK